MIVRCCFRAQKTFCPRASVFNELFLELNFFELYGCQKKKFAIVRFLQRAGRCTEPTKKSVVVVMLLCLSTNFHINTFFSTDFFFQSHISRIICSYAYLFCWIESSGNSRVSLYTKSSRYRGNAKLMVWKIKRRVRGGYIYVYMHNKSARHLYNQLMNSARVHKFGWGPRRFHCFYL